MERMDLYLIEETLQITNKIKKFISLNTNEIHRLKLNAKKAINENHNPSNYIEILIFLF